MIRSTLLSPISPGKFSHLLTSSSLTLVDGGKRGVARLPSFSSTQLSKLSVEQRKMRLKQNLLPNPNLNSGKGMYLESKMKNVVSR